MYLSVIDRYTMLHYNYYFYLVILNHTMIRIAADNTDKTFIWKKKKKIAYKSWVKGTTGNSHVQISWSTCEYNITAFKLSAFSLSFLLI